MTLCNLIDIADDEMTMTLFGKDSNGNQYRYDFKNKSWSSSLTLNTDKLVTVKQFRHSLVYDKTKWNKLILWSIIKVKNSKILQDINDILHVKRDRIVSITISI